MQDKTIHILTHDVPWPADFGGVMDLFYKIKSLQQAGVKIKLHCFVNKRNPQLELEKYCESVSYYDRKKIKGISFSIPFIVSSRKNNLLIENLQKDNHPILIEGIHCSYYHFKGALKNRIVLLRLHNAEFEYYHQLAIHEKNWLKKLHFHFESFLLKKYEKKIAQKTTIAAVSQQDVALYQQQFKNTNIFYLPVFIPYTQPMGKEGNGCYCLYHGNLSINENEEAVIWLLQNVFNDSSIPFVITGKNPSERLQKLAHQHENTCLVANPDDKELHDIIAKAQINILPSFNNTGVKLKLLNALYNGRHCIVNKAGVEGTGLESLCIIAEDADDFKTSISYLYNIAYQQNENEKRSNCLLPLYNNNLNAEKLIAFFWK